MTWRLQTKAQENGRYLVQSAASFCLRWGQTTFYATYTCIVYKAIIRPGRTAVQFQALVLSVEMFSEPWHEFRVLDSASHSLSLQ